MGASQSNLSPLKYDVVIATTQASINTTMNVFLSELTEPVVTVCYVANEQGNPVEIGYDQLKKNAKGSDPFAIPAGANPVTNPDLLNLRVARFMMGFRARIGLPPSLSWEKIPDVVTLDDGTSAVIFRLLCSEFTVVELDPGGGYSPPSWMNESQDPSKPWIFTAKVDLRLSSTSTTAYSKLPPAVQRQIHDLGPAAFSVQQLFFDLDSAALESVPAIAGPGTKVLTVLEQFFLGAYFAQMRKNGTPVLGYAIKRPEQEAATLTLTDLNMEVSPLLGRDGQQIKNPGPAQQDLATLCYLCATGGDPLPPAAPFSWNWVEPEEEGDYHGVVAINRNAFVKYLRDQLINYVRSNCYQPAVRTTYVTGKDDVDYWWQLTAYQEPTVSTPSTGTTVLGFHYDPGAASDQAGLNGDEGKMVVHPSFDLNVTVSGNIITIRQHLIIYAYVRHYATAADGNVVDVAITDTYTLAITQDGRLTATMATDKQDNSKHPSVNAFLDFFTKVNDLANDVGDWLRKITYTNLEDLPLSVVQNFVFPGGKTFAFKSVAFSDHQDLVSHITYADPTT